MGRGAQLKVAPIEKCLVQLARINAVHTVNIDRHHLVAIGTDPFGEGRDAAIGAKVVIDYGSVNGDIKPILIYSDKPKVAKSG